MKLQVEPHLAKLSESLSGTPRILLRFSAQQAGPLPVRVIVFTFGLTEAAAVFGQNKTESASDKPILYLQIWAYIGKRQLNPKEMLKQTLHQLVCNYNYAQLRLHPPPFNRAPMEHMFGAAVALNTPGSVSIPWQQPLRNPHGKKQAFFSGEDLFKCLPTTTTQQVPTCTPFQRNNAKSGEDKHESHTNDTVNR